MREQGTGRNRESDPIPLRISRAQGLTLPAL